MPSLEDIANQVNNTLNQINTNTQDTADTCGLIKGDTADIKAKIDKLNADMIIGFANLSTGMAVMIENQKTANALLDHNRQQNDTIICWLTNIADLLCRQLHRLNTQIQIQKKMYGELWQVRSILELVHGTETVLTNRHKSIQEILEECCPEEPEKPEHCYEECKLEPYRPHKPHDIPWEPLSHEQKKTDAPD